MSQPEVNIGLVGHVDHGKTTLLEALSGKWADTHSEELKRGITIRLGYADATFYKDEKGNYTITKTPKSKELRTVSFVDAPGHETLMATMLSGAAIMDGAVLLISANEACPQPQTKEHLMALEIVGIKNIVIAQNKIDAVSEKEAIKNYEDIKNFIKGTIAENAPIVPISALHKININYLIEAIENTIKTPKRDTDKDPLFFVARSFDINKPGTEIKDLIGGVLGGSLKQGILKVKDKIEIRPGIKDEKENWVPLKTEIVNLKTGGKSVKQITAGGSIGILTKLDPSIVKSDQLAGNMVGKPDNLPQVWNNFKLRVHLLKRVVGLKEDLAVEPIKKAEPLVLNVNSSTTSGIVIETKKDEILIKLKRTVCSEKSSKIAVSRMIGNRWRLVGWGEIL